MSTGPPVCPPTEKYCTIYWPAFTYPIVDLKDNQNFPGVKELQYFTVRVFGNALSTNLPPTSLNINPNTKLLGWSLDNNRSFRQTSFLTPYADIIAIRYTVNDSLVELLVRGTSASHQFFPQQARAFATQIGRKFLGPWTTKGQPLYTEVLRIKAEVFFTNSVPTANSYDFSLDLPCLISSSANDPGPVTPPPTP